MRDYDPSVRVNFKASDETPFFAERLAPAYFAALAAACGQAPPSELPEPKMRAGASEPYADAPPWERYTWRADGITVSVRIEPRCSGHGVHGSDMQWTLRGAPCGVLSGHSTADARGGGRYAELRIGKLYDDERAAAGVARAFRAALDGTSARSEAHEDDTE